jgi:hypothetical protein
VQVDFAAGYVLAVWVILLSPVVTLAELKRRIVLANFHLVGPNSRAHPAAAH